MSIRSENLERWRRIAAGSLEDEDIDTAALLTWIREVAAKVVAADASETAVRPGDLLRALGLSSRAGALEPIRDQLEVLDSFDLHDDQGNVREAQRGERTRNLIAAVRASGLVGDDLTDDEIRKRIERLFAR